MAWETVPYVEDDTPKHYTMEPHHWKHVRFMSWQVCAYCGLVALKNDFTRWAMRMGCNYKLHRDYQAQYNQSGIDPQKEKR